MQGENEGDPSRYQDEDGRTVKHKLYDEEIIIENLGMLSQSETMGQLKQRLAPDDPLDKLDRVIFPIALIGVAFGLYLILTSI